MGKEAGRCSRLMPALHKKVQDLLNHTSQCLISFLHPSVHVPPLLITSLLRTQQKSIDFMTGVEDYMMQSKVSQFFNSSDVKKLENLMEELEQRVSMIVSIGEVAKLQSTEIYVILPPIYERSSVTPYFTGREEEMSTLENTLDKYNSAAIMQYGGIGKTQLMTAFAEKAEKKSWISGGSYWTQAHGDKNKLLSALVRFASSLTGIRLVGEEKRDFDLVISMLKRKLRSSKEKWFLCIDNADDPTTNSVIGSLCTLTRTGTSKGWVLVTSRQGCRTMRPGMVSPQKLLLNPLNVTQAMITLFRWKEEYLEFELSEEEVRDRMSKMRIKNRDEFQALQELSGSTAANGLGGLLLALTQAGRFIIRYAEFYRR